MAAWRAIDIGVGLGLGAGIDGFLSLLFFHLPFTPPFLCFSLTVTERLLLATEGTIAFALSISDSGQADSVGWCGWMDHQSVQSAWERG